MVMLINEIINMTQSEKTLSGDHLGPATIQPTIYLR